MGETVTLYTSQAKAVLHALWQDGVCHSRREYVVRKYGESAPIFLSAYDWFVKSAQDYAKRPPDCEYPYWAFCQLYCVDQATDGSVLKMKVPVEEAVFFDMYDWKKIMCLQYIGETQEEERQFRSRLSDCGVRQESDVILTHFYPELKRQVQESWRRLFRHHEKIKSGDSDGVGAIQAGLWRLDLRWVER